MGRKIPAKKHRGVKDPLVQQAKRLESLKGKINAPPRDPDEQPVPKSLLRLFGADRPAARGDKSKVKQQRRDKSRDAAKGAGGGGNPVAKLKRLPGESARAFSRRITGAARALHDATDGQHYPMEEEEDEPEERWRRRKGKGGEGGEGGRPTKAQRRKLVLQQRNKEQAQARSEAISAARREVVYEHIEFGERADAPPALPAPRLPLPALHREKLAASRTAAPRPGQRDLLLTQLLDGSGHTEKCSKVNKLCDSAGARKGGALLAKQAAEQRRLAAVAAYRALKRNVKAQQPALPHSTR